MCGRYGGAKHLGHYTEVLKRPFGPTTSAGREVAPKDMTDIFATGSDGTVKLIPARWSLIPSTFTGPVARWTATTAHARLEDVDHKPAFASAWQRKRRALIPADAFWEWSERLGRARVKKQRWQVTAADGSPLALAGIWDHARTADGPVLSFALLTRAPGERMGRMHDREPVVIAADDMAAWLAGSDDLDLLTPWADEAFDLRPVA